MQTCCLAAINTLPYLYQMYKKYQQEHSEQIMSDKYIA